MKALLAAIKLALQTDLDDYIRPGDIYITEDLRVIPSHVKFPAIGIKDGEVQRFELPGEVIQFKMKATVAAYVQLQKPEASVMGDEATGQKGVLDVIADIHDVLHGNLLGISGMQKAFGPKEGESELVGDEDRNLALQMKPVIYEYEKED